MPPIPRPFPRFIADPPQESKPYGRWEERLSAEFAKACGPLADEAGAPLDPETLNWFPERSWGGRVYVPATGRAPRATPDEGEDRAGRVLRLGLVRAPPTDGRARRAARRRADFTDVTAEDNPDWQIDLNDDVIGTWRTDGDRGGDVTLVWGLPLVRGAVAATAELDGEVDRPGGRHRGAFHAGRRRRRQRVRRRPLPRGQALEPDAARDRVREPLRGVRRRLSRLTAPASFGAKAPHQLL